MRQISEIKSRLLDHGALGAVMTGTGSAVFGLFQDPASAERCAEELKAEFRFCHTAEPVARLDV